MEHLRLVKCAVDALGEVAEDRSVDCERRKKSLVDLREEIDVLIEELE